MKRTFIWIFPALLLLLAACGGSDEGEPRPTELRVVTGEPTDIPTSATPIAIQINTLTPDEPREGVIVVPSAILLAGPNLDSDELATLNQGVSLEVTARTEPDRIGVVFYQVQYDDTEGWVANTQIEFAPAAAGDVAADAASTDAADDAEEVAAAPTATRPSASATPLPTLTPIPSNTPTITPTPLPEGYPTPEIYSLALVEQLFERGRMIWYQPLREIWVMIGDEVDPTEGEWRCFVDAFAEGEPERDPNLDPPEGTVLTTDFQGAVPMQPIRGFGKVWRANPEIREALGWAYVPETLYNTRYQYLANGQVDDDGDFDAAPGEIRIDSFYQETMIFYEDDIRAPCQERTGTWEIIPN